MGRVRVEQTTTLGETLVKIAEVNPIPPETDRLACAIANASNALALDQFEVRARVGGGQVITLASAGGDYTSPVAPLAGASGDLTGLAAGAVGDLLIDAKGLNAIELWAAAAAAAAATGVLTASGNPTGGVQAVGTLTAADVPVGAAASVGVLTGTTIAAGDTVVIGGITYTFVASLNTLSPPYQVALGATDSASLDNLIAAINGAEHNGWTLYSRLTDPHPTVTAAAGAGDTADITARTRGVGGDAITTTDTLTAGGFGAATLENGVAGDTITIGTTVYTLDAGTVEETPYHVLVGVDADATLDNLEAAINGAAGEGTLYGSGTVAHALVTAENQGDDTIDVTTILATAAVIATTETGGDLSWGAATLQSGVAADTLVLGDVTYIFDAAGALIDLPNHVVVGASASLTLDNLIAAINAAAGAGTAYGTGTAQNALVAAVAGAGDTVNLTARATGIAGNSITQDADGSSALAYSTPLESGTGPAQVTAHISD